MRRYYKKSSCGCGYKKGGTVKDACYTKVKKQYNVFPSADASCGSAKGRNKKAGKECGRSTILAVIYV